MNAELQPANDKLLIDVGSTYLKVCANGKLEQYFRDFNKKIIDDLSNKCADTLSSFDKDNTYICSSANGGLNTLIIGLTNSFSLKYAITIAYNSGINIIDTVLYEQIEETSVPSGLIDVVIVVGGIDSIKNVFGDRLFAFLDKISYSNIVYAGNKDNRKKLQDNIPGLNVLNNIVNHKLQIEEAELKDYLTNLYQADIVAKEDIKHLYEITSNQIYSTPYIVNKTLPLISERFSVTDPAILIDIGGATTDIHYSKDLVNDNMVIENEYDRLVFKKLGVFKSRESLIFSAKSNDFVYELLGHLLVTENIFNDHSEKATKILMQLAIFLVLCKVSSYDDDYVTLKLTSLNTMVFTGGITKVLQHEDISKIVGFFYRKILNSAHAPILVLDNNYDIWTLGMAG